MKSESAAVQKGVRNAWNFWLDQHPVSLGEIIQESIERAFTFWLNDHSDEIVEAIAKLARTES